jgi:hypothetical protein
MQLPSTRAVLAAAIVLYIGATEAAIMLLPISPGIAHVLEIIVGVLIAKFSTVYDWYFGSSKPQAAGE